MEDTRTSQQIQLMDGRRLGYAEYGSPGGQPVLYFHGFPGSRLDWGITHDDSTLTALDVRVIAPDRPGYGLSDHQQPRNMLDWTGDVIELANSLQIDQFAVLGISGGGPYAAACAFGIRERLLAAGIVGGLGPSDAPGMKQGASWTIPGTHPLIRQLILRLMSIGLERDPARFLQKNKAAMSNTDGHLLDQPGLAASFIEGLREAFRHGIRGVNLDAALYAGPWGFKLRDLTTRVYLWHGEQDLNVPVSVGHAVAEAIPYCHTIFHKTEGHLTLPHNHVREILSCLVA